MSNPKDTEEGNSSFSTLSETERYLRSDIEHYKKHADLLENRIAEKDKIISKLNGAISNLKDELFDLKLRLNSSEDYSQKPLITRQLIERKIASRGLARIVECLLNYGSSHYKEIAKSTHMTEQYVNSCLNKAHPLIEPLGGGRYALIDDNIIRSRIREVAERKLIERENR